MDQIYKVSQALAKHPRPASGAGLARSFCFQFPPRLDSKNGSAYEKPNWARRNLFLTSAFDSSSITVLGWVRQAFTWTEWHGRQLIRMRYSKKKLSNKLSITTNVLQLPMFWPLLWGPRLYKYTLNFGDYYHHQIFRSFDIWFTFNPLWWLWTHSDWHA